MSHPRLVLWIGLVLFGFGRQAAEACTCLAPGPPCQAFWDAAAVFVGRVESIATPSKPSPTARRAVTFSVLESFRGVSSARVVVDTGRGGGDCGYGFKPGATYLVYASRHSQTGELSTSICSRTRPIATASDDIEYGRAVTTGNAPPARVSGRVTVGSDSLQSLSRRPPSRPLAGVTLLLDRAGSSRPAVTGDDGTFEFEGLEPGKYSVRIAIPDGYYSSGFPRDLELRDTRACAEVDAVLLFDGRVAGRVVDAQQRPVPGLTVELTVRTGIDQPVGPRRLRTTTGGDGSYEFTRVPPGRFIIGINTQLDRAGQVPEARVFLPGVRESASAREIVVGGGERVRAGDFVLPADVHHIPMAGIVLDSDGSPVEGARVYLKGSQEDYILTEPSITDATGRFIVAALTGRGYVVFAERTRAGNGGSRLDVSDQLSVVPTEASPPLVLRLKRKY
jgi:protocatechuate 3,4-dioxygenase beta subunit